MPKNWAEGDTVFPFSDCRVDLACRQLIGLLACAARVSVSVSCGPCRNAHLPTRILLASLPIQTAGIGFSLKWVLDTHTMSKYQHFDELRDMMIGTVFFLAIVLVLIPIEVSCVRPLRV